MLCISGRDGAGGSVLLETATVTAAARIAFRNYRHVAELARHAVGAMHDFAVDHDAAKTLERNLATCSACFATGCKTAAGSGLCTEGICSSFGKNLRVYAARAF